MGVAVAAVEQRSRMIVVAQQFEVEPIGIEMIICYLFKKNILFL